jgi:hypothetical protein
MGKENNKIGNTKTKNWTLLFRLASLCVQVAARINLPCSIRSYCCGEIARSDNAGVQLQKDEPCAGGTGPC